MFFYHLLHHSSALTANTIATVANVLMPNVSYQIIRRINTDCASRLGND